jgi:hypothetical protein
MRSGEVGGRKIHQLSGLTFLSVNVVKVTDGVLEQTLADLTIPSRRCCSTDLNLCLSHNLSLSNFTLKIEILFAGFDISSFGALSRR